MITLAQWEARKRIARAAWELWLPDWESARGGEMPRDWSALCEQTPVKDSIIVQALSPIPVRLCAHASGVIKITSRLHSQGAVYVQGNRVSGYGKGTWRVDLAVKLLSYARKVTGIDGSAEPSAIEFLYKSQGFCIDALDLSEPWHERAAMAYAAAKAEERYREGL